MQEIITENKQDKQRIEDKRTDIATIATTQK